MQKNRTVGYILAFFLGALGLHAFYYKKYVRGIIYIIISVITQPVPVMMFVGWIDMFFIKKWDEEFTKTVTESSIKEEQSTGESVGNVLSSGKDLLKENEKHTSLTKEDEGIDNKNKSDSLFYNEAENILEKYAHIKTPEHILDGLYQYLKQDDIADSRISISIETNGTTFIQDSVEYRWVYSNEEVREIPLQEYWTTFRDLNERQLNWYFYWRTQVLHQTYLDADLSYIILFVYELMNYSFNNNAAFNVSMLETLYEQYKTRQPKLGNYLPQWIADMLYELNEPELAKAWDAPSEEIPHLYSALEENYPLSDISMKTWNTYIQYGRKSAYFNENRAKVYNVYKKSVGLLETYYNEKGESLIENWFEIKEVREVRHPFKSGVMGRSYDSVHVPVTYYLATKCLKKQTTALMKYAENISRELNGISYRVKVDEDVLPEALREGIRANFLNDPAKPRMNEKETTDERERFKVVKDMMVEEAGGSIPKASFEYLEGEEKDESDIETFFDATRIDALAKQTDNLVDIFNSDENNDKMLIDKQEKLSPNKLESDFNELFTMDDVEEEDYADFIDALNEVEKRFIFFFSQRIDYMISSEDAAEFSKQSGAMLGVFLSELNQKANEYLGDVLIEESNDNYHLSEEFIAFLEKLEEGAVHENQET